MILSILLAINIFLNINSSEIAKVLQSNKLGQNLSAALPSFSHDIVGIVYGYLDGWSQAQEFNLPGPGTIIAFIQLQNNDCVYATSDRIIICNQDYDVMQVLHTSGLNFLISTQNNTFRSVNWPSSVRLWELNNENLYHNQSSVHYWQNHFYSLIQSSNGDIIIALPKVIKKYNSNFEFVGEQHFDYREGFNYCESLDKLLKVIHLKNGNFAMAFKDGLIQIFDATFNPLLERIKTGSNVQALIPLPNGDFASGHEDGSVRIWSPNLENKQIFTPSTFAITCLATLNNGNFISIDKNRTVRVWQNPTL